MVGNSDKAAFGGAVKQAARLIAAAGRKLASEKVTASLSSIACQVYPDTARLAREVDLLLVFGGDGTILGVAREIAGVHTPILGVNIGSLGFLTAVPSSELGKALRCVWKGEFNFESRSLIEVSGDCQSRSVSQTALNDIVISRGMASRLIELDVRVDGESLSCYRCDGLIVSTPTGSTAYSLAAGGAVVFPTAQVLELTPICPHTLSNRSLILPSTSTLTIKVISAQSTAVLSADGQVASEVSPGDILTIRRSRQSVRLMHLAGSSFCDTLRRKLHWRGTPL